MWLFFPRHIGDNKELSLLLSFSRGPLIRKASSPQPFFPQHTLVTDFHTGDVGSLTERLLAADLSLVVYYAPWDRDSQTLRWEVERAAQYHHEQVSQGALHSSFTMEEGKHDEC